MGEGVAGRCSGIISGPAGIPVVSAGLEKSLELAFITALTGSGTAQRAGTPGSGSCREIKNEESYSRLVRGGGDFNPIPCQTFNR